jgi:hypothetical protein
LDIFIFELMRTAVGAILSNCDDHLTVRMSVRYWQDVRRQLPVTQTALLTALPMG